MRRAKWCVSLGVEAMESKELLSGGVPTLTMNALNGVVGDVQRIMGNLVRTQNDAHASAALARLSARIPFGATQLNPTWQRDLSTFAAGKAPPGTLLKTQILRDLYNDVFQGVRNGEFRVVGPGSTIFYVLGPPPGVPAYDANSVNLVNDTGMPLSITAIYDNTGSHIPMYPQIATGATNYLDFGNSTPYQSIYIASINNATTYNYYLPTPGLGSPYNGEYFYITWNGSYYFISQNPPV